MCSGAGAGALQQQQQKEVACRSRRARALDGWIGWPGNRRANGVIFFDPPDLSDNSVGPDRAAIKAHMLLRVCWWGVRLFDVAEWSMSRHAVVGVAARLESSKEMHGNACLICRD